MRKSMIGLLNQSTAIRTPPSCRELSIVKADLRTRSVRGLTVQVVAVTASTGIAAVNIRGCTVHAFAGVGLAEGSKELLAESAFRNQVVRDRWRKTDVLLVDEVRQPRTVTKRYIIVTSSVHHRYIIGTSSVHHRYIIIIIITSSSHGHTYIYILVYISTVIYRWTASPGVDGQKDLRLQFNSQQSSTVDTNIPFSARHLEYFTEYSTYIPCRQTAIGWPTVDSGACLDGDIPQHRLILTPQPQLC
eukprot:1180952-Prorocentrum_minimum.AAC.11